VVQQADVHNGYHWLWQNKDSHLRSMSLLMNPVMAIVIAGQIVIIRRPVLVGFNFNAIKHQAEVPPYMPTMYGETPA
jgi:hypothetical protein